MATLSLQIKRFIIQQLACFEPPSAVAEAVKAEFGVTITRQAVEHYDPTKGGEGKRLAGEHKELFEATRARFIREADVIGISHQVYRLAQLQRAADHAKSRNNWGLLLDVLERAAKEVGGAYTNKREHSGPDGTPIPLSVEVQKSSLAGKMLQKLLRKGMSEEDARASLISLGVSEHDLPPVQGSRV